MPFNHGMSWNGGDRYNVVGHVGKGAFANVYKLSTKANGDLIAAKEIEKRKYLKDGILDRKAHNEIEIMRNVNHVRMSLRLFTKQRRLMRDNYRTTSFNTSGTTKPTLTCTCSWNLCPAEI